jgi:poly-gamma-glutamate synthesis protein (capsule biosynthesis protein)
MSDAVFRLCLAGDVMLGRGIDQIQAHPGDPRIHESWARSALQYVELAELTSGPLPRNVPADYVWGDLLPTLADTSIDALIVNLETSVTDRGRPWPGKGIQYRMNPANVGILTSAGIDVATLANNHVLDWSEPGLLQTLETLAEAGIHSVGAGKDADRAWQPVRLVRRRGGIVVLGLGTPGSGIPGQWAASDSRPGVALAGDFSAETVERVRRAVAAVSRAGDLVVVSIHWGGNWGYGVTSARRRFAHRLIDDAGVDVIHGHSSHHPIGIEVHAGRLILYGCGDLITDYEGIAGHERYRGDLGAVYLPSFDIGGRVTDLEIVPMRVSGFRLTRPSPEDVGWLEHALNEASTPFGAAVAVDERGRLHLSQ